MEKHSKAKHLSVVVLAAGVAMLGGTKANATNVEKCYGIVKKGENDCGSAENGHACQGQSKVDGDPHEWIYVLKGTCNKIVNGKTQ